MSGVLKGDLVASRSVFCRSLSAWCMKFLDVGMIDVPYSRIGSMHVFHIRLAKCGDIPS